MKNLIVSRFIVVASVVLMLSGCGTNIFKGLDGTSHGTSVQQGKDALDKGDYSLALSEAEKMLSDPAVTTENKIVAYELKGQAILGQNNLTALDFAANLTKFNDQTIVDSGLGNEQDNVVESLRSVVSAVPTQDMQNAADALNSAADLLGAPSIDIDSVGRPVLHRASSSVYIPRSDAYKKFALIRGIANLAVVVSDLTTYFVIDTDAETIEFVSGYSEENVESILRYLATRVHTYVHNANDSLRAIDGFPISDTILEKVHTASKYMETLDQKVRLNESYRGFSFGVDLSTQTRQHNIRLAIADILKGIR
ncbi:MAG: hypothetical protein EXS67_04680 [Candidatus Margulisbacteria bacterium]|nr:hypothetical protein [Candidatus Margulisiibacteriota bacterium]